MKKLILIKPLITEKAMLDDSVYVFDVLPKATKTEIKAAIQEVYGVTVGSVRTATDKGKIKAVGKRRSIRKQQPISKKAYVKVTKGEIPDIRVK